MSIAVNRRQVMETCNCHCSDCCQVSESSHRFFLNITAGFFEIRVANGTRRSVFPSGDGDFSSRRREHLRLNRVSFVTENRIRNRTSCESRERVNRAAESAPTIGRILSGSPTGSLSVIGSPRVVSSIHRILLRLIRESIIISILGGPAPRRFARENPDADSGRRV